MLYIIDGNRYYRLGFQYLKFLLECARRCNAHRQNFKRPLFMDKNIKFRLLCRLWEDNSISAEELEILVSGDSVEPNDMILWAVINGREDLVSILLQKGANPDKCGYHDGVPALFRAAESYKHGATFSTISLLLRNGANPHSFMEWFGYRGTIAVVAFKAFGINILKAA